MDDQNPAVLMSRIICYEPLSSICIVIVLKNFEDSIFVHDQVARENSKNYIPRKLVPIRYVCVCVCVYFHVSVGIGMH